MRCAGCEELPVVPDRRRRERRTAKKRSPLSSHQPVTRSETAALNVVGTYREGLLPHRPEARR